jgi:hypothetical protein
MHQTPRTNGFLDIPSSRPGRISAIAGAIVFSLLHLIPAMTASLTESDALAAKALFLGMVAALGVASVIAVGSGAVAIIRDHVRSFVTLVAMLFGTLASWLLFIELVTGHG